MLLALLIACAVSCANPPSDRSANRGQATFTRAELRATTPGSPYKNPVVVSGAELDELLRFVPGIAGGRKSGAPGFWEQGYQLDLTRADGTVHPVIIEFGMRYWSDRKGNWFLAEGFRDVATRLLREANPTNTTSRQES